MATSFMDFEEELIPLSQESDDFEVTPTPPKRFRRSSCEDTNQNNSSRSHDRGWEAWNSEVLAAKLDEEGLSDVAEIFKGQEIVGCVLPRLTEDHLDRYGISKLGKKLQVMKFIEELIMNVKDIDMDESKRKIFNDPIHGHIELHPLCVRIIDTPQFQRLRFIKQLGTCYFVYPGATHNRFEHSLGVCHLAGRLVRAIKRRQPELGITDKDVLCVEIAGLCHDLGHGPFSHLFDGKFIPHMCPETKWKHEDASRMMFRYMLEENNLHPVFEKEGLSHTDITFIEEQVTGPKKNLESGSWPYDGRPKNKSFLYEVVANKRNGIDVDKWDYFARDCHMLGIRNNFDHNRCIHFARVLQVEGELQICSRDKEVGNLYDMFHTRSTLHRRAYQHKTTNIIDTMIVEALVKANNYIKFAGKDGHEVRMSDAIHDMKAYSQMTDHVFFLILNSTEPKLQESKEILSNIMRRNLYKCVGQTQLKHEHIISKDQLPKITGEILSKMDPDELECSNLKPDKVIVHLVYLDYGMKDKNPIDNVRFYSKENPNVAVRVRKDQVSNLLPETFAEQQIRVHCKLVDTRTLDMVKRAFCDWCKDNNLPSPKGGEVNSLELTPVTKQTRASTPNNGVQNGTSNDHTPDSAGKFKSRLSF
ncbi:deoxynucleoside triphosphate triphosphohydrolase SAMHD1-like [Mercenaria mercenaria]|uniref:deoxynucleoside triphosphate triphosphohydrolase SAMHD1-like n=1 Tax=Mercenaria mercenaria TaxID=6596 RepID=UPI00234F3115|nr:deoxynucleoside triphosphate triphosphohydrolase SAMHD1-like [Mercenaria mercenaria]